MSTRRNTVDIRSRQSICQHERLTAIRRIGDVSVHAIRDEAISLNPWQHNEQTPIIHLQSRWNMSCSYVLSGRARVTRDNLMPRGESVPPKKGGVCKERFGEIERQKRSMKDES